MNNSIRTNFYVFAALFAQPFFLPQASAQEDSSTELSTIVHAISKGWEQADGTPFREHFLDFEGARFIEGGGQNTGLSELIDHHVVPEGDALDSLELAFLNIETHVEGEFAWAIADTEIRATVKSDKRQIHNRGYETFLFRRVGGEWKVVHTHSSSRPVIEEGGHDHAESHE
jgi:hypothetical protein